MVVMFNQSSVIFWQVKSFELFTGNGLFGLFELQTVLCVPQWCWDFVTDVAKMIKQSDPFPESYYALPVVHSDGFPVPLRQSEPKTPPWMAWTFVDLRRQVNNLLWQMSCRGPRVYIAAVKDKLTIIGPIFSTCFPLCNNEGEMTINQNNGKF